MFSYLIKIDQLVAVGELKNIHYTYLISKKNYYMSSQYFLRYVLGINSKKHANFMDEEPDISKN